MFDSELYILDEPTAGLDPLSARTLKKIISGMKANGKTFIFISHIISDIEELADRIIYLLDGEVFIDEYIDTLRNIADEETLEAAISKFIGVRQEQCCFKNFGYPAINA